MSKPAFPNPKLFDTRAYGVELVNQPITFEASTGVTLRDLFAAFSLTGLRAREADPNLGSYTTTEKIAADAYQDADAMLAQRARTSPL